jgi:protease I
VKALITTSTQGFDPSEVAIPWKILHQAGVDVRFATDTGQQASPDQIMLTGEGLGPFKRALIARKDAREACEALQTDPHFQAPMDYATINPDDFDGLLLPGGHAKEVRPYLESKTLQKAIVAFFKADKPVAAICHGTIAAARAIDPDTGKSILHGRTTTALLKRQELIGHRLTKRWMGDYYLTYPTTVEDAVTAALRTKNDFNQGPLPVLRDSPDHMARGFTHKDGHYLSARWPGDVYSFATDFLAMLQETPPPSALHT